MFIASLVPLRLIEITSEAVLWENPRPSSTRFCRPISIEFAKETAEKTENVVADIKSEISSLVPLQIDIHGKRLKVKYELHLTAIDGKVCSTLTDHRRQHMWCAKLNLRK